MKVLLNALSRSGCSIDLYSQREKNSNGHCCSKLSRNRQWPLSFLLIKILFWACNLRKQMKRLDSHCFSTHFQATKINGAYTCITLFLYLFLRRRSPLESPRLFFLSLSFIFFFFRFHRSREQNDNLNRSDKENTDYYRHEW